MLIGLLVAGIAAIVAGLLAIAYGFMLELSFGNTMILAGAFGVCSGIIVLALGLVVHELRNLGRKLGSRAAAEARAWSAPGAGDDDRALPRDLAAMDAPMPPVSGLPWREDAASRDRTRQEGRQEARQESRQESTVPPPEVAEPAPPPPPRRRNLMFSSTVRKEREHPLRPGGESFPPDQPPALPEDADAPSPSFEDGWPRGERARPAEPALRRTRPPSAFGDGRAGTPERAVPPLRNEEPLPEPAVTVIKSGVVDGMAYSLYSDGSIEAQMPEGMMRFGSIDELRAHLDQRL